MDLANPQPLFRSTHYAQSRAYVSLCWDTPRLWISISLFIPQAQPQGTWDIPQGLPLLIFPKHNLEPPSAIFLFWPPPPASCSGCGPLSLPLLAGLVATDAVVSLLIVAVVFVCARLRSRPTQGEGRKGLGLKGVVSLGRRFLWRGPPGKPWRHCWGNPGGIAWGELLRKPLKHRVPREVEEWVGGGWSGLTLSLPHHQKMAKSTSICLAGANPPVTMTFDF